MSRGPLRLWSPRAGWCALGASLLGHAALLGGAWSVGCWGPGGDTWTSPEVWAVTVDLGFIQGNSSDGTGHQEPELLDPVEVQETIGGAVTVPEEPGTPDPIPSMPQSPALPGHGGKGSSSGHAGPGSTAARGPAHFFALPILAQRVVFLIDRSISMELTQGLAGAKHQLAQCLVLFPETAQFQIILYNRELRFLGGKRGFLNASPENIAAVLQELESVGAEGGTDHGQALQFALSLEPDVLFLVTDADDLGNDKVRSLTQRNAGRTVIHTLAWRRGSAEGSPLKRLAELNQGTHRVILP